jgi:Ca2+-binding RTX toxin-like protein
MQLNDAANTLAQSVNVTDTQEYEVYQDHPFLCSCSGCEHDQAEVEGYDPAWSGATQTGSYTSYTGSGGLAMADTILSSTPNFGYAIDVIDSVGSLSWSVLNKFEAVVDAAMKTWAYYLRGHSDANIEVEVHVGGTSAVASAGPGAMYFGEYIDSNRSGKIDNGDFRVVTPGSLMELQTGVDPNSGADIVVYVNENLLANSRFFFDATLSKSVPSGAIDFYSVMLHELGHGLGFIGINSEAGQFSTRTFYVDGRTVEVEYGTMMDYYTRVGSDGVARFNGRNVKDAYGEGLAIETNTGSSGSDLSHFAGKAYDGVASDLRHTLMNPYTIGGDRVEIGQLELEFLKDIGYNVARNAGQFTNTIDGVPLPEASVRSNISLSGTTFTIRIALDSSYQPSGVSSSVGYEIIGANGRSVEGRVVFASGDLLEAVSVNGETLFGSNLKNYSGSVTVKLFNPVNAELGNGGMQQTYKLGTSQPAPSEPEPAPAPEPEPAPAPEPEPEPSASSAPSSTLDFGSLVGLYGGSNDNELTGTYRNEFIYGRRGADTIDGRGGSDVLIGGTGNDVLIGGSGNDYYFGDDLWKFDVRDSNTYVLDKTGHEHIVRFEADNGRDNYHDTLQTSYRTGGSSYYEAAIDDLLSKGLSTVSDFLALADYIDRDGSSGSKVEAFGNTVKFTFDSKTSFTVHNLHHDTDDVAWLFQNYAGDHQSNISSGLVSIEGTSDNDFLVGTVFDDFLVGGDSRDMLFGNAGNDMMTGGRGADRFGVGNGLDTITDYGLTWDWLMLQNQVGARASRNNTALTEYVENGINGKADLLDFISLLENDGRWRTHVLIDDDDLLFVFDRSNDGVATDGVRLEGLVGGEVSRSELLNAGASDMRPNEVNPWDVFDDAVVA